ncbi:hypothetical protein TNCV_1428351 [Trichonephila clavipes]|nr:hypothetical protein TNCV_1428351 [Trichonephila clavipes]
MAYLSHWIEREDPVLWLPEWPDLLPLGFLSIGHSQRDVSRRRESTNGLSCSSASYLYFWGHRPAAPTTKLLYDILNIHRGRDSLVVRVTDSWLASHEFEPSAVEDPPCRGGQCALILSWLKRPSVAVRQTKDSPMFRIPRKNGSATQTGYLSMVETQCRFIHWAPGASAQKPGTQKGPDKLD